MSLVANAACLDCGKPVHGACHAGEPVHIDCETSRDGEYAFMAGVFHRVVKRGEPSSVYTIREEYTAPLMRFAAHKRTCTASLRPEPASDKQETKKTPIRQRRERGS